MSLSWVMLLKSTQNGEETTHHFGCRVQNLHLFQDSGTIVSDCHISLGILDLGIKGRNTALLSSCKPFI